LEHLIIAAILGLSTTTTAAAVVVTVVVGIDVTVFDINFL